MNVQYQNDDNEVVRVSQKKPQYVSLYFVTHLILSFFAIYLSWKCGGSQFSPLHFLAALLFPHLYIVWALAMYGGCGVFECSSPAVRI